MEITIIIPLCVLLLIAYVFDITASKTRVPSIILLLIMGFGLNQIFTFTGIKIPNLKPLLPVLGTIGLILIVLEGALELKLSKDKISLIGKSSISALIPMLILAIAIVFPLHVLGDIPISSALINAIPLCIISSAIAIPTARNLSNHNKEFVTYESSLSDIFGVIIFNFITVNEIINGAAIGFFFVEILIMLVVSIVASAVLSIFIARIKHQIKFIPIILSVTLIYGIAKFYHLPALIFILIFGLALHNIDLLKQIKYFESMNFQYLKKEVHRFIGITSEFAFLIRSTFFLLFGFFIEAKDIVNLKTLPWAIMIFSTIFLLRTLALNFLKLKLSPLLYLAPRGLITILLFLSIPLNHKVEIVNNALMIQVILLCALFMMGGLMTYKEIVDIFIPDEIPFKKKKKNLKRQSDIPASEGSAIKQREGFLDNYNHSLKKNLLNNDTEEPTSDIES